MKLTVETEPFEEWLFSLHHRFYDMVQTMMDVFEVFKAQMNTESLIPLDTGRLERSFHYQIYENTNFIEMYSIFSAVDPKSNYDYAYYQHELEYRGVLTYSAYTKDSSRYTTSRSLQRLNRHRHGTRGTDHYLYKGIDGSETLMWTIIEQDYLSLFDGGL